jgi:hypothetical protein
MNSNVDYTRHYSPNLIQSYSHNLHSDPKPIAGYNKFTIKAVCSLVFGCCILSIIGTLFAWGCIYPYVTGYFRD